MNVETSEKSDKKEYELSVLLREEGSVKGVLKLLTQHGAEIKEEGQLRKIQFAYPVDHVAQGYFGFLKVSSLPAEMKSLEKDLRTENGILRSLIVALPTGKKANAEVSRLPSRRPERPGPASRRPSVPATEAPVRKPLSNEAIEKKIEEILQ
ncbi:MAG: 30S ribosomal protein S6 [Candidatus Liptonbacteria bacterium]|nr:30S ribosomal protein S6 [Candidatus Liptonbacteria bacterium]